jgi:hypothetical protein
VPGPLESLLLTDQKKPLSEPLALCSMKDVANGAKADDEILAEFDKIKIE